MVREFSVKLKSGNNKARVAFIICMSSAFLFVMLSTVIPLYKGMVSLLGMVLLIGALVLYTKYISPIYYYDIMIDSGNTPLLVVRQRIGKRESTLCRIALYEIVKIDSEDAKKRRAHKTPAGFIKYNYSPTLCPDRTYRLTTMSGYEKSEIILEISDDYAELLSKYADEAREMRGEI